nr:MAG TPA: hypothetical protein [Caudoviricetes sp.]
MRYPIQKTGIDNKKRAFDSSFSFYSINGIISHLQFGWRGLPITFS